MANGNETIPVGEVVSQIRELEREIQHLEELRSRRRELDKLLLRARATASAQCGRRFGPRRALIYLLRATPRSSSELIASALQNLQSKAKDHRRVLITTLGQLRSNGTIVSRGDGTLALAEEDELVTV